MEAAAAFIFAASITMAVLVATLVGAQPPSNTYGPPQKEFKHRQYLPPFMKYGPPGFTPGEPLSLSKSFTISQSEQCPRNDPVTNKIIVQRMYQEVFGDKNFANLEIFFDKDYIQHNPMGGDGIDGFRKVLMGPLGEGPMMKIDIRRISAEDDLVWTHTKLPLFGKLYSVADIFRFECGKIKEHWDILQDTKLLMPSANSHPFF